MRSDFWSLPYAAQMAIRRGEAAESRARRLNHELNREQAKEPVSPKETIVAAAFRFDLKGSDDIRAWSPTIVSAPPPARHHNLFALAGTPDADGFLTSTGRFVEREEALQIVLASGQPMIDHPSRHSRLLFSEDLW